MLLRALYFLEHTGSPLFALPLLDQKYYDGFARALLGEGSLRDFAGFRPMLYPLFLAAWYWIAGPAMGIVLAIAVQHALGVATALLVASVAGRMFRSARAALAAGLLYALASPPLYFEGDLLIEPFLAFLVMALLWLIAHTVAQSGGRRIAGWIACGVLASFAAQARPNMVLFFAAFPAVAGLHWLSCRRRESLLPLLALAAAFVTQALWGFANARQSGYYQFVTGAGGINLYVGNNRQADGMIPRQARAATYSGEYRDSIQVFAEQEYRREIAARGTAPSDDPRVISDFWSAKARGEIAADPPRWIGLMLKKSWLMAWNHEVANNNSFSFILREESLLLRLLPVRWWLLLALAPAGAWFAWRRGDRRILAFVVAHILLYSASIALFFVNSRFRIPIWPTMAILAGGGVAWAWDFGRHPARERLALCSAALGMAALSLANWWRVPPDDYSRDYFFRSIANFEIGRPADAVADARRAVELDPANADIHFQLGNALFAADDFANARLSFLHVTGMEPAEPRAWNNLGATLEALDDHAGAYQAYLRALEVAPGHLSSLAGAAILEIRAGFLDDAEPRVEKALSSGGVTRADVLFAKAILLRARGRGADAAEWLARAQATAPALVARMLQQYEVKLPPRQLRPE